MGFASSEGVEAYLVLVEVDDGADEAVDPMGVGKEVVSEDWYVSAVVGASQVDDGSPEVRLEVETPWLRERASGGGGFDAGCVAGARGGDVALGAVSQSAEASVLEACPDFRLPTGVEAFDGGLEAGFVGNGEDGGDIEAEAEAYHAADGVGVLSRSGEAVVVVELGIAGQSEFAPVLVERFEDAVGSELPLGPDGREASVQRNSRENREVRPAADGHAFDGVEAVEFAASVGDFGEIPAFGRRGAAGGGGVAFGRPGRRAEQGSGRWCAPRGPSRWPAAAVPGGWPGRRTRPTGFVPGVACERRGPVARSTP